MSALYESLAQEGVTDVIHISISSGLSGTFNMVRMITQDFESRMRVHMVDSRTLSMGLGMMVLAAARALEEGATPEEAIERAQTERRNQLGMFVIRTLEFLRKGGRIGKVEGVVGSLLQIKPIIYVNDEGIYATLAKARGYKSAVDTMVGEVKRFLGGAKAELSVVNGKAREEAEKLMERLRSELDVTGETYIMSVSPVLAIHTGPGHWALGPTGRTRCDGRRIERQVRADGLRAAQHARLRPDGVCVQHHLQPRVEHRPLRAAVRAQQAHAGQQEQAVISVAGAGQAQADFRVHLPCGGEALPARVRYLGADGHGYTNHHAPGAVGLTKRRPGRLGAAFMYAHQRKRRPGAVQPAQGQVHAQAGDAAAVAAENLLQEHAFRLARLAGLQGRDGRQPQSGAGGGHGGGHGLDGFSPQAWQVQGG